MNSNGTNYLTQKKLIRTKQNYLQQNKNEFEQNKVI
jgi:hypothetical protein